MDGSGRGLIQKFTLRGRGKLRETPARTTRVLAEIWTHYLPNTSLERYGYANLLDIIAELTLKEKLRGEGPSFVC
jgi:hypothetical protein